MPRHLRLLLLCSAVCATAVMSLSAQQMNPTPNRHAGEGEGPVARLVIRGITFIDGTGAPPRGPMDIVVQNNRITDVVSVGFRRRDQRAQPAAKGARSTAPAYRCRLSTHVHCGGGQARDPDTSTSCG
jgi:hypothetical protein